MARTKDASAPGPDNNFSRAQYLANVLQARIVEGHYPPGYRFTEQELQTEFSFSNGPTREALQMIVASGLAERIPWQGVRVINLGEREILELFQLRAALLRYVVEMAANHGDAEVLAKGAAVKKSLQRVFEKSSEAGENLPFSGQLSAWLLAAAGNQTIIRLWENTMLRAQIYVNASMSKNAGAGAAPVLYELIDAVAARETEKALNVTQRLLKLTIQNLGLEGPI